MSKHYCMSSLLIFRHWFLVRDASYRIICSCMFQLKFAIGRNAFHMWWNGEALPDFQHCFPPEQLFGIKTYGLGGYSISAKAI